MPEPATITLVGTGFIAMAVRFLRRKYSAAKPWFDRCLALALLLLLWPLVLICALVVKMSSRGPAFYRQQRVGENGRLFTIIKLRTMREDAEEESGPVWAAGDDDARLTRFGRLLRKTHLDELPQLVNVLKGDMSLVGPRPERPYFVERLKKVVPDYESRLRVKPGITGLAQLRVRADRDVRDVRRKVKLDGIYASRMCWWVDFMILIRTMGKFAGRN